MSNEQCKENLHDCPNNIDGWCISCEEWVSKINMRCVDPIILGVGGQDGRSKR